MQTRTFWQSSCWHSPSTYVVSLPVCRRLLCHYTSPSRWPHAFSSAVYNVRRPQKRKVYLFYMYSCPRLQRSSWHAAVFVCVFKWTLWTFEQLGRTWTSLIPKALLGIWTLAQGADICHLFGKLGVCAEQEWRGVHWLDELEHTHARPRVDANGKTWTALATVDSTLSQGLYLLFIARFLVSLSIDHSK